MDKNLKEKFFFKQLEKRRANSSHMYYSRVLFKPTASFLFIESANRRVNEKQTNFPCYFCMFPETFSGIGSRINIIVPFVCL
jgi:hypothetical protein